MGNLRLPRIENSLCGCTLQTGCKVIAYLHLILVALGTFLLAYEGRHHYRRYGSPDPYSFASVFLREESAFANEVCTMVFSALVLYGVNKRSSMLMEPFILMKGTIIVMSLLNIAGFAASRVHGQKELLVFPLLISMVLQCYMFTVVYSYKGQLEENHQ